jgi:hypothetical protein
MQRFAKASPILKAQENRKKVLSEYICESSPQKSSLLALIKRKRRPGAA